MSDALITRLSSINRIIIRPTSAIAGYDSLQRDAAEVGRELGVDKVLEGCFQRVGERIRVTVQLVSVGDGTILWADKFNEEFTDIIAIEDSISEQVAAALTLKLSEDERKLLTKRHNENNDAHHSYLKGRYHWNKRTAAGLKKGIH
jgi:TolB-like protein